jgi:phenylalanyl-tRNA synthetase alpha chain
MVGSPQDEADALVAELDRLGEAFAREIEALATEQEIRAVQARYLGKKGGVSEVMRALGRLDAGARPRVGEAANRTRAAIEKAVDARLAGLADAAMAADLARAVDVTLPGRGRRTGTLHPLTLVRREIEEIFRGVGFEVRTGPWVETEWNNFDALNTPPDHPARDMQDTFFVDGGNVLRSHTSPVQVRTMLSVARLLKDAPAGRLPRVKIIAPGYVFRRDDDATHTPMFPQVEGLEVGPDVSFADLKGVLGYFVERFFGPSVRIRMRPSFFPFTEPSAEVDASCFRCPVDAPAADCRLCKGTGWLEIGGCGMVHPNVFRAVGFDRWDVTGYAFGMGLSRMAMRKYGVSDLRTFHDNDLRFLRQFAADER